MTLSYWREYRTYFHLAKSFDTSESSCYRNIKWIENILIKHSYFQQLAGKKSPINDYFNGLRKKSNKKCKTHNRVL
ncbi:MAG: transposase family protein [Spiroplasma phoeniceum]|nr:MAG: transposase family protein [Spiroplasma phoeniceum]UZQ31922.1 MAG: transposase family protein [Spiroplasma phoeniceum]